MKVNYNWKSVRHAKLIEKNLLFKKNLMAGEASVETLDCLIQMSGELIAWKARETWL